MDPILVRQLINHINWQTQKLVQIGQSILELQKKCDDLNKSQAPTVDKIEYNFDQLKIEKLEGTLNIGITPGNGKSIEDLSVNGQTLEESVQSVNEDRAFHARVRNKINEYLDTAVPPELQRLNAEFRLALSYEQVTMIIEDLRGQIDGRIRHYSAEDTIIEKVKKDIGQGLQQYIGKLKESERVSP